MRRFEVVIDLSKQLISLAVALIGGSMALSESIFTNLSAGPILFTFSIAIVCWATSILAGIMNIGATINQIEHQEKLVHDASDNFKIKRKHKFLSIFESNFGPKTALAQSLLFVFGTLIFGVSFALDKGILKMCPT